MSVILEFLRWYAGVGVLMFYVNNLIDLLKGRFTIFGMFCNVVLAAAWPLDLIAAYQEFRGRR